MKSYFQERFPHLDKPVPAFATSPQSFGNLLNFHPHLHALSSLGVFDADGVFHEDSDADHATLVHSLCEALLDRLLKDGVIDQRTRCPHQILGPLRVRRTCRANHQCGQQGTT